MKSYFTVLLLCAVSLLACRCKPSGSQRTPDANDTTVVIQTIKCVADTEQSYCIALPSGFDPALAYPVIFVFDPHGEGNLAVNLFRTGATEYGHIVAGSNTIRNGYEKTEYALQALMDDITRRYKVDMARIYAAGFSGGARVAQVFSQRNPSVKSIACIGAGYSVEQTGTFRNKVPMLFIVGNEDFNYHEVRNSYRILKSSGIQCYVIEYPGKHAWPGPEIIKDALLWFEFDAYRRNPGHAKKQVVREFLEAIRQLGDIQEERQEILSAAATYAKGISFLSEIANTSSLKRKLEGLQNTEAFKLSEKQGNEALDMEIRLQQGYLLALRERDTLWWRNEMRGLDEKISRGDNGIMQPVYNRIRSYISIAAYGYCNGSLKQNDLVNAERFIAVYRIVDPGNPDGFYFNALFLVKSGQENAAADSFRKAVSLGFTDFKKARQELPEKVFSMGYQP